jgi:putative cell wall-binding protein/photosystem II stability/assembly factor-like uncharacterized protein
MKSSARSLRPFLVVTMSVAIAMMWGVAPAGAVGEAKWGQMSFPPGRTGCLAIEQTAEQIVFGSFTGGTAATGIERSYDGGQTWETVCTAQAGTYTIHDIDFYDRYHGFAVGRFTDVGVAQSLVLETQDGGLNWTRVDDKAGTTENALTAVDYDDGYYAAAVGSGGLFYQKNLNGTWQGTTVGTADLTDVAVVHYGSEMRGVIVGEGGTIWKMTRSTSAWSFVERTNAGLATEDLYCISDRGSTGGFVVFGEGGFELTSSDWGLNWARTTGVGFPLETQRYMATDFLDVNHGLAVGFRHRTIPFDLISKAVRRTSNALVTWTTDTLPTGGSPTLTGVSMLSSSETWAHSSDTVYHLAFPTLDRFGGSDRYATATQINARTFIVPYGQSAVFATGKNFPDALCASGLAGTVNGPLVIVKDTLSAEQLSYLVSLGIDTGYIVGGENVVSPAVGAQLTSAGIQWQRFGGSDRYATAALVADKITALHISCCEPTDRVLLARGDTFPDALAFSPLAYSQGIPILLTRPTSLPSSTAGCIDTNGFKTGYVGGDVSAVSASVKQQFDALLTANGGAVSGRWGGINRYDTASIIAGYGVNYGWASGSYIGVATGLNFPDALVGGCAVGSQSGVLLLTKPDALSGSAQTFIEDYRRFDTDMRIYGSNDAVSDAVMQQLTLLIP